MIVSGRVAEPADGRVLRRRCHIDRVETVWLRIAKCWPQRLPAEIGHQSTMGEDISVLHVDDNPAFGSLVEAFLS
ncbi:hypothetical protein [Halovivax asiaticus]|uniref:hypothetical protein n=1 Tax=Halovivax asiaticus TaxID=332953 RepID=UPI0006780E25|nr:hypothetical protein [Halovivax asiaticus]